MKNEFGVVTALAAMLATPIAADAATATLYGTRATFLAALGSPTVTQDFEGFAPGANLVGVDVLPGVTLSTNLANLEVVTAGADQAASAFPRNQPEALYNINIGGNYSAFGFDIEGYDPAATPGTGFIDIFFTDGDLTFTNIPYLPGDPIFVGVISDTPIQGIRWNEGPMAGGITCCETTELDNLAAPVPEPSAYALMLAGLLAAGTVGWRRRGRG